MGTQDPHFHGIPKITCQGTSRWYITGNHQTFYSFEYERLACETKSGLGMSLQVSWYVEEVLVQLSIKFGVIIY